MVEGDGIDANVIDFSMAFNLVPHEGLLTKLATLGVEFEGSRLGKGIPCRSFMKGKSRRTTIQGRQSNLRCAARDRFGPTTFASVRE